MQKESMKRAHVHDRPIRPLALQKRFMQDISFTLQDIIKESELLDVVLTRFFARLRSSRLVPKPHIEFLEATIFELAKIRKELGRIHTELDRIIKE